ncbi:hypothetical protein KY290_014664 [Solanum tuberosum]|uniref:CCHC-type domain-containing protein n=1 Tax=Solanum tuberosum TaxID=4113 RepID=A0ABQ7VS08_SOLTU|nr:hypothetical protein KY290_014664 [Solanum tuberosum]
MTSSTDRPREADREGSGTSVPRPHALEEIGEHFSNQYVPHTSGSEVGNYQGVRAGPYPHMSRGTQAMNPPYQQMAEFLHHMAEAIHDPNVINFEKMRKMGGVEFEGTVDPTDVEQWLERMEREKDKCRKFEDGLNDSIRKNVAILQHEPPQQKQNRSDFSTTSTLTYGQNKPRVPTCPQCGKNHYGTCRRASGACFNCGSFDHKVKDCPNPNNAPFFRTQGSVHKLSINPSQTNGGARPKNTNAAGTSGANQASGERTTARAYAMR